MASNPYVNKVEYGGAILIDLTADTVTADKIVKGYTAHNMAGEPITGTMVSPVTEPLPIMSASDLFKNSTATSLNLSCLDTGNVTTMANMFYGCSNLTSLDVSSLNTSNVTTMTNMFYGCTNLAELNLDNFNASKVTSTKYMFYNCESLTELDLSNFNFTSGTLADVKDMFYGCESLTTLI